jgi:hypothetical protein
VHIDAIELTSGAVLVLRRGLGRIAQGCTHTNLPFEDAGQAPQSGAHGCDLQERADQKVGGLSHLVCI